MQITKQIGVLVTGQLGKANCGRLTLYACQFPPYLVVYIGPADSAASIAMYMTHATLS